MIKNVELAQTVVNFFAEHPDMLDMGSFGSIDKTGAHMCFAAGAVLLSQQGTWHRDNVSPSRDFYLRSHKGSVPTAAADALGLGLLSLGLFMFTTNETLPGMLENIFGPDIDVSALRDVVGAP